MLPAVPLKLELGLEAVPKLPPVPLTMLHAPVPLPGAFAPSVTVVNPQVAIPVWLAPATAVLGFLLNVITTSSVDAVQGAFDIVQRNV